MLSRIPQTFFTELFMVDLINRINLYFSEVPEKVIANRKKIWIGFLLLTILLAIGISKIKTEMAMESFFEKDEPVKEAYNLFKSYFGSDEVLYIVYRAKDGDVFSIRSLSALKQLQERLVLLSYQRSSDKEKTLQHIEEVTTLINAGYLEPGKDMLISRDFIGNNIPENKDAIEKLRKQAKN
ncbi:MAG: hypothetical protein OEY59_12840, partial [Deltaproteobacteria bacterium]|nr:hypothetical protein [Deltaproteobacteria bacterium]